MFECVLTTVKTQAKIQEKKPTVTNKGYWCTWSDEKLDLKTKMQYSKRKSWKLLLVVDNVFATFQIFSEYFVYKILHLFCFLISENHNTSYLLGIKNFHN